MNTVEVCLSPDLISQFDQSGKIVVVVDILRATSCFTAGMHSGVKTIVPFSDVEECRKMAAKGYVTAGERGGQKVDGFEIGNSPFDYMKNEMKGRRVAVTTTNGTRAIKLSETSDQIVIGSFLNLGSVSEYLIAEGKDCLIFCAGWKGKVNLEDSLFAGALIKELTGNFQPIDDSALLCRSSFVTVRDQLPEIIAKSEHAQRLSGYNMARDIAFCSRINEFDVLPIVKDGRIVKL